MKGFGNNNKADIEILSKEYIKRKRMIREMEDNIIQYNRRNMESCYRIVLHIEYVVENLDDIDKLIIKNELLEGKTGEWYLSYFSPTCYYHRREKAYENFLHCL